MDITIALVAFILGLLAFAVGVVATCDPEGRGGNLVFLIFGGGLVAAIALSYLGWRGITASLGG